jgi:4-hydroxybenzoate polyprenyltransferase
MSEQKPDLVPIAVDMDGTLIRSDLLIESFLLLIRQNPLILFQALLWLLKGKAYLKQEIACRIALPVHLLPYNQAVLDFLAEKRRLGHPIALATASHRVYARAVADHLKLFDQVFATEGDTNLSGDRKRSALNAAFGSRGYWYIGNGRVDLKVWQDAAGAVVVGDARLAGEAARQCPVEYHIANPLPPLKVWLKALRVHQWVKNGLIFVPLLAAHQVQSGGALAAAVFAFIAFSLCASSVYLLNDLLDLPEDRQHATKRLRPFAAGTLDPLYGLAGAPMLLLVAMIMAACVSSAFLLVLLVYYALTFAYSFQLKRIVLIDVVTLAGLYTIRIIAGAAAIEVPLSFWLLAFSVFVFLSLAIVKRYTELVALREQNRSGTLGRGYQVDDLELLASLGGSAGYLSVLVLALYINSNEVRLLYGQPELMWPICLVMLYWISRVWVIAHRGGMNDDPIVFALKDRVSLLCGGVVAVFMMLASWASAGGS